MATFQELADAQKAVGDELHRAFENYKKEGKDRKTVDKLRQRKEKIQSMWIQFNSAHAQLVAQFEDNETHPYITKGFYEQVTPLFQSFIKKLDEDLAKMMAIAEDQETTAETSQTSKADSLSKVFSKNLHLQAATIAALERLLNTILEEVNIQHSKAYYNQRLLSIKEYWQEIASLHRRIVPEASSAYDINAYRRIEDLYQRVVITLQEGLDQLEESSTVTNLSNINLPKITLPSFDGQVTAWSQFKDLFTQLIHKQPLGEAEKLYYLKANLSGEPSKLISHLPATSDNYTTAWRLLMDRYDNKRALTTALLTQLLSQPTLGAESGQGLRHLHDTSRECLLALSNLGIKTKEWDPIVVHLLLQKLDRESRRLYEQSLTCPRELQPLEQFFKFLEARFQMMEAIQSKVEKKRSSAFMVTSPAHSCVICKAEHKIFNCSRFLQLSVEDRIAALKRHKLCLNCLKPANHNLNNCPSRGCKRCNGRHNTLTHVDRQPSQQPNNKQHLPATKGKVQIPSSPSSKTQPGALQPTMNQSGNTSLNASSRTHVLLATAVLHVTSSTGTLLPCRVLLDSGSQIHFISERMVHALGLKRKKNDIQFKGIGGIETTAKHAVDLCIQARTGNFKTKITATVLPKISGYHPTTFIATTSWNIPENLQLADPTFFKPQAIDMLLGAELYLQLLTSGQIKLQDDLPLLQNTKLGWILTGRIPVEGPISYECNIATQPSITALDRQVRQFWEMEQHQGPSNRMTKEEHDCEEHFQDTFQRSSNGRFIVRLPFREPSTGLGESQTMATKRFLALERKLQRNPDLKRQYSDFIHEYETLGHMHPISQETIPQTHYFLPHHAVMKPDSSTTKLRVVFDASAKTTSGNSLNNLLMVGPTVQSDLFTILLRFRMHRYVITADINKMYRQIEVDPSDRPFQLIIWRDKREDALQYFQLNTITYGTASAPFLATRCLKQLALNGDDTAPDASKAILNDTYVDDILTGSDSMQGVIRLKTQLISLLKEGHFELRKFCSNHPDILRDIPEDHKEKMLIIHETEVIKALGMIWQPKEDVFQYQASQENSGKINKRTVLSDVARIFDPLGLIGPVTVLGKLFIQELWKQGVSWDEELPATSREKWRSFKGGLAALSTLRVPRHVKFSCATDVQLHAFSDSSEAAYGACCYIRSTNQIGQARVRLLCAKSRLAPLQTTTLARLELCAAVLMVELVERVLQCLPTQLSQVCYYTDSTTVLHWISAPSYTWNTYVANRVSKIQGLTQVEQWRHIEGSNNPADIISRGMTPEALVQSTLWLKGPQFLTEGNLPKAKFQPSIDVPERRIMKSVLSTAVSENFFSAIKHGNSLTRLQRIIAYCIRALNNGKRSRELWPIGTPTATELDQALNAIIRVEQRSAFSKEIRLLKAGEELDNKSPLKPLSVFLDQTIGLIRVGGRLRQSDLEEEAKNQLLLPKGKVTDMLFRHLHQKHLHAGPQTLLAIVRQRFWVLDGRRIAQRTVQECVRCFHCKPRAAEQVMGHLPEERVRPSRPFHTTGVDFCGPVDIYYKLRGKSPTKAYIAVFICFTTRAIHLEVVSDLSALSFLNCLKRFIARRGLCAKIFCDNATNFVGARSNLRELREAFNSQAVQSAVSHLCAENHIEWKPIPPRSPHFGGLWEAAVKSAKYHLIRQAGRAHLTYEELHTLISQIEAILNSRPLTPMSSDPNDLEALTPGHFLIGAPLTSFAEPDTSDENLNRLSRFQRLQTLQQSFWKRWTREYIQELQRKQKWRTEKTNLQRGTLVLIKDINLPPLKWPLGRILDTYEGPDKHTRVATVKTTTGCYKRAISNLCPLPIEDSPKNKDNVEPITSLVTVTTFSEEGNFKELFNRPRRHTSSLTCKPSRHPNKGRFLPIQQWGDPAATTDGNSDTPREPLQPSSHPSKKAKLSPGSAVVTTLLACIVLPFLQTGATPVELRPFQSQPGIFFENLGPANIVTNEWQIIAFFNMTPFWNEFNALMTHNRNLKTLCHKLVNHDPCERLLSSFQHITEELAETNKLLLPTPSSPRTKRGAINFIGSIANSLFGVLDANYAEQMSKTLGTIHQNEKHLKQLLANQTSVLDATLNIMRRDQEAVNNQLQSWTAQINHLTAQVNEVVEEAFQEKLANAFNLMAMQAYMVSSHVQHTQESILEVLTDTHHGKLNPLLVTPDQLSMNLKQIRNNLPPSLRLPAAQDDILQFYNLISIQGRPTLDHIIFKITIPLVAIEDFELLKVIPVPVPYNHTFVAVQPSSSFLITNLHRDEYCPLQNLLSCVRINRERHLCKHAQPVHRRNINASACEIELLNHLEHPRTCKVTDVGPGPHWIPLYNSNQWIYAMEEPTTANVVCRDKVYQINIEGSGVLQLLEDCIIKQPHLTIRSHTVDHTTTALSFLPISNLTIPVNLTRPATVPSVHDKYHTQLAELEVLKTKIEQLQREEKGINLDPQEIHQFTVSYIALLLIVLIIAWFTLRQYRKWKPRNQHSNNTEVPIPRPRTSIHREEEGSSFEINFSS